MPRRFFRSRPRRPLGDILQRLTFTDPDSVIAIHWIAYRCEQRADRRARRRKRRHHAAA